MSSPTVSLPLPRTAAPLDVQHVAGAVGGFLALAAAGALGATDTSEALRLLPSAAVAATVPLVFTTPALLVVHQAMGLHGSPHDLLGAILDALVGCGRLALGLAPAVLFFSATSGLGQPLYVLASVALLAVGLTQAARGLKAADAAGTDHDDAELRSRRALLVSGWFVLTGLITLRVGFGLLDFAL